MREFLVKTSGGTDNGWGPWGLKYDLLPARFEKHPTPDKRGRKDAKKARRSAKEGEE